MSWSPPDDVIGVDEEEPFSSVVTPGVQLLFGNIYLGIAEGALAQAKQLMLARPGSWFLSGVDRYSQDPITHRTFGELVAKTAAVEALVKVGAAGVCLSDVHLIEGLLTPSLLEGDVVTLGHEVAGTVHTLGDGVTGWSVSDRVVVTPITIDNGNKFTHMRKSIVGHYGSEPHDVEKLIDLTRLGRLEHKEGHPIRLALIA